MERTISQFVLRTSDKHPTTGGKKSAGISEAVAHLVHRYQSPTTTCAYCSSAAMEGMDAADIPPTYSVDIDPDILIRDVYENQRRYVTFIVEDLWDFVPSLYKAVKGKEMQRWTRHGSNGERRCDCVLRVS